MVTSQKIFAMQVFTAEQVIGARYTPVELRDAGFSAQELKDANLSCSGFHESGCSAKELLSLELFSVTEMRLEGGYSATELRLADISAKQLDGRSPTGHTNVPGLASPSRWCRSDIIHDPFSRSRSGGAGGS